MSMKASTTGLFLNNNNNNIQFNNIVKSILKSVSMFQTKKKITQVFFYEKSIKIFINLSLSIRHEKKKSKMNVH